MLPLLSCSSNINVSPAPIIILFLKHQCFRNLLPLLSCSSNINRLCGDLLPLLSCSSNINVLDYVGTCSHYYPVRQTSMYQLCGELPLLSCSSNEMSDYVGTCSHYYPVRNINVSDYVGTCSHYYPEFQIMWGHYYPVRQTSMFQIVGTCSHYYPVRQTSMFQIMWGPAPIIILFVKHQCFRLCGDLLPLLSIVSDYVGTCSHYYPVRQTSMFQIMWGPAPIIILVVQCFRLCGDLLPLLSCSSNINVSDYVGTCSHYYPVRQTSMFQIMWGPAPIIILFLKHQCFRLCGDLLPLLSCSSNINVSDYVGTCSHYYPVPQTSMFQIMWGPAPIIILFLKHQCFRLCGDLLPLLSCSSNINVSDYAVQIFYDAIATGHHECFLKPDTILPMMYITDCIKVALFKKLKYS